MRNTLLYRLIIKQLLIDVGSAYLKASLRSGLFAMAHLSALSLHISDRPDLSDSPHNYNETGPVRLGLVWKHYHGRVST